jgi:hypothetical protein
MYSHAILFFAILFVLSLPGCDETTGYKKQTPVSLTLHDSIIQPVKIAVKNAKQCTLRFIDHSSGIDEIEQTDSIEINSNVPLILQLLDSFPHIVKETDIRENITCGCWSKAKIICDNRVVMDNYWQVYPGQIIVNDRVFQFDTCNGSKFIFYLCHNRKKQIQ